MATSLTEFVSVNHTVSGGYLERTLKFEGLRSVIQEKAEAGWLSCGYVPTEFYYPGGSLESIDLVFQQEAR
jgi:hypothetical protein